MDKQKLIDKVLCGQATEIEERELDQWMASDMKNFEEVEDMKLLYEADRYWDAEKNNDMDENYYDGLESILSRITMVERRRNSIRHIQTGAAALLISAVIFFTTISQINGVRVAESLPTHGSAGLVLLKSNLAFDHTPLKTICEILEAGYPVSIRVDNNSSLRCSFSGTFYHGTPIDDILHTLAQAEGLQVAGTQGNFRLYGEGCAR